MPALKPGSRFTSSVCTTQMIVVKGDGVPEEGASGGTLMGKRYVDADETVEVLCTRPGDGSLGVGDTLLDLKDAKPLPASD